MKSRDIASVSRHAQCQDLIVFTFIVTHQNIVCI